MSVPRSLDIVIVNWNTGDLLRECLASIRNAVVPYGWKLASIVVVDNASADGSQLNLTDNGLPLVVIQNRVNRGFAAACNQGAAGLRGDYLLLLNPDTRLFGNSLSVPLLWMDMAENARTGIVSIPLEDESGRVGCTCARFPRFRHFLAQALGVDRVWPATGHLMREWSHGDTRNVDQVIGAYFLVRRALWDALGGLDERFFVYFEEVDFSLRASKAGYASTFLADARAFHLGGGASSRVKAMRLFYMLRSRLQYASKNYSFAERALTTALTFVLEPLARSVHLLLAGRFAEISSVTEAYRLLWRYRQHAASVSEKPEGA